MCSRKVMVVDDDQGIREMMQLVLSRAGYEVETQTDDSFVNKDHDHYPDLYLLDIQLGISDGLEICRRLKRNPATFKIPVLMISASPDISVQWKQAGANGYIEKPFGLKYFLQKVADAVE